MSPHPRASHSPRHRLPREPRPRRRRRVARLAGTTVRVRRAGLLIRFGVLSAVLLAGLGVVLGAVLQDTVERRALTQGERTVQSILTVAVQPQISLEDFRQGRIDPARLAALRSSLQAVGSGGQALRVKVYDRDGRMLYSDDTELIGRQTMSDDLATALTGRVASHVEQEADEESERGLGQLLEVYAPVRMQVPGKGEQVVGAFEMYFPYGPIASGAATDVRQLVWLTGIGLVVLWLGLFRLVVMASRRLRQHAEGNQWLAQHDTLTGLPNRSLFASTAEQAVRQAQRDGTSTAVLLVNLDRFTDVNNTLGHHVGDGLLRAVGERLRERLTDADTVARFGADEFAVLLPVVGGVPAAEEVARRLLGALQEPFVVEDLTLEIDASVGVAGCPEHAGDEHRLLQRADIALHQAKQSPDGLVTYQPRYDVHTPERLALFGELRRAIDEDQLVLHYQPKVDVLDGRVVGVEALVRWQHPHRGLLSPADFIPVAEQTGLIRPMTLHLLSLALRDCRAWRQAGLQLSVAVNLSARNLLDTDLPGEVQRLLTEADLPAEALDLEITETTAMADPGRALGVLDSLRGLGVRLSVDDYGTGHASLAYLHQLPVHTLKIDKSFVQTMDSNPHEATIVRSTIDLARSLGLEVVAEGVESEAAWRQLNLLGCNAAQGFWLARPSAAPDIPETIARLEQRLLAAVPSAA